MICRNQSAVERSGFHRFGVGLFCASATLLGCHKTETQQTVLAQVDQDKLTLEDVRESFPPELEKVLPREQYLDFLQRWVEDEVVYQQALKRKFDQDPKVLRKLENMRRKVIIEEFLAHEGSGDDYEPDEGAMSRYYEMHKESFRRNAPEFRYATIRVGSVKDAQTVRAQVKGDNFLAVAEKYSVSSSEEPAAHPFRKAAEIPGCLLQELNDAKIGFLSSPITCPDGVYLVKLMDRVEAGTLIPFAEAKDAISGQLAMEQRDKMRTAKIRQYKEGAAISFNLDKIPGLEAPAESASDAVPASGAMASDSASALATSVPAAKPLPKKSGGRRHRREGAPTEPSMPQAQAQTAPLAAPPSTPSEPVAPAAPTEGNEHAPVESPAH